MLHGLARLVGRGLARFLNKSTGDYEHFSATPEDRLKSVLIPGDILLVEGKTRISTVIKYLTQSTWSHAALYVGDAASCEGPTGGRVLVEADLIHGVVAVPLAKYSRYNTRICRAIGLSAADRAAVVTFACEQLGLRYDLKNIFDLLRYFLPLPLVTSRFRRRFLAFGSSDPTQAICSTIIAHAFQNVDYPILPRETEYRSGDDDAQQILHKRHYTHFVPRDFDLSPYFRVVKPTLQMGFNHRDIVWRDDPVPGPVS